MNLGLPTLNYLLCAKRPLLYIRIDQSKQTYRTASERLRSVTVCEIEASGLFLWQRSKTY